MICIRQCTTCKKVKAFSLSKRLMLVSGPWNQVLNFTRHHYYHPWCFINAYAADPTMRPSDNVASYMRILAGETHFHHGQYGFYTLEDVEKMFNDHTRKGTPESEQKDFQR